MKILIVTILVAMCLLEGATALPPAQAGSVRLTKLEQGPSGHLYVGIAGSPYTLGSGRVETFALNAHGNAKPLTVLTGPHTRLMSPQDFAWDSKGFLYVMDSGYIYRTGPYIAPFIFVFAPGATGDVPPVRVITGRHVDLSSGVAIAVDSLGYTYVADFLNCPMPILAPGANGDARPVSEIDCSDAPASLALVNDRTLFAGWGPLNEFKRVSKLGWKDERRLQIGGGFIAAGNHTVYDNEGSKPGYVQEYRESDLMPIGQLTVPRGEFRFLWHLAAAHDGDVYVEAYRHRRSNKPAAIAIFYATGKPATSPILPSAYLEGSNTGLTAGVLGLKVGP